MCRVVFENVETDTSAVEKVNYPDVTHNFKAATIGEMSLSCNMSKTSNQMNVRGREGANEIC